MHSSMMTIAARSRELRMRREGARPRNVCVYACMHVRTDWILQTNSLLVRTQQDQERAGGVGAERGRRRYVYRLAAVGRVEACVVVNDRSRPPCNCHLRYYNKKLNSYTTVLLEYYNTRKLSYEGGLPATANCDIIPPCNCQLRYYNKK